MRRKSLPAYIVILLLLLDSGCSSLISGRAVLVEGEKEYPGYGLYSYLLFGSRPSPASRERYVKTIDAFLKLLEPIAKYERGRNRSQLNVTYLPITNLPAPEKLARLDVPEWLLKHYDYERAQVILSSISSDAQTEGPYIVSFSKPLSDIGTISGQYLYQDLSTVPPDLVSLWVKQFIKQAAQERFWERRRTDEFVLRLRDGVTECAVAVGDIVKDLQEFKSTLLTLIQWKKR